VLADRSEWALNGPFAVLPYAQLNEMADVYSQRRDAAPSAADTSVGMSSGALDAWSNLDVDIVLVAHDRSDSTSKRYAQRFADVARRFCNEMPLTPDSKTSANLVDTCGKKLACRPFSARNRRVRAWGLRY